MNPQTKADFRKIGVEVPSILLPKDGIDMTKWSVVACDQFTSEPEYWEKVAELVGEAPSTFKMVFPEVYLESNDKEEKIKKVQATMGEFLAAGILEEAVEGFVLVNRKTKNAESRKGLIVALDLEHYDYHKGSKTLIRATEGTVESRIPPRLSIRRGAPVELPHIMVLINDPNKTVIEPAFTKISAGRPIYDFELMMEGGHLRGWKIGDEAMLTEIAQNLASLISADGLLFAMGDGNHSLATAKAYWEEIKAKLSEEERENHPARFALVELINVHDEGLKFEPIHRVIFNIDPADLEAAVSGEGMEVEMIAGGNAKKIKIKDRGSNLPVGNLQILLDEYIATHTEAKIDYVHGEEAIRKLTADPKNAAFLLPTMDKLDLFKTVELDGALPRKTFSMGEAEEKRYYLEARRIQ